MSEYDLYAELKLEATRLGHRLFRNNIGRARYVDKRGKVYTVPYGVGGVGGGDMIGWTNRMRGSPPAFMPQHSIAIFTAIEVKTPGKRTDKKRLEDQKRFIEAVIAAGGIAGFVESIEDYRKLVGAV